MCISIIYFLLYWYGYCLSLPIGILSILLLVWYWYGSPYPLSYRIVSIFYGIVSSTLVATILSYRYPILLSMLYFNEGSPNGFCVYVHVHGIGFGSHPMASSYHSMMYRISMYLFLAAC